MIYKLKLHSLLACKKSAANCWLLRPPKISLRCQVQNTVIFLVLNKTLPSYAIRVVVITNMPLIINLLYIYISRYFYLDNHTTFTLQIYLPIFTSQSYDVITKRYENKGISYDVGHQFHWSSSMSLSFNFLSRMR